MQAPPPPSITPRQMNLLRVVTSMAWSDGHLASEEIDLMLDRFSGMFAADAPQQQHLRQELQEYMTQNIPLEELTPKLQSVEERELVLRLGYEVIRSSARTSTEEKINEEEAAAYTRLVQLLNLPVEIVQQVESEVSTQPSSEGIVDSLTRKLEKFMQG
ncbi:MAG: TerB family tellurite resistance protein [Leptolyngbyaceae cyanobacterium SM1_4_3]|nr:TerB family tellurite resistance protein [Leptolyngbyaceae cyanobacterium SM1_4_3]NJN90632.1 TerB family tellurite resistance protein [Leptolyngbyaceae cyanobacterium SL_5_14]NJO66497.1 TerB family tellurite resistance protein [Leptolyngbyaceae cyanobacterium RM1_405_57]